MRGKTNIIKPAAFCFLICLLLINPLIQAQEETREHVAAALDNYYSLSLKYDVSIQELKAANPGIINPKPGDIIIIPRKGTFKAVADGGDCDKLKKNRNEVYRVALMIPFYLEQITDTLWKYHLNPENANDLQPFRFIQFYHGFMMAADSLRQKGLNVEIYVYDVDHLASKVLTVIAKPELKKMDMIFGPFFKNSFSIVAEFAKENKIPIINPLSARSDILQGNPYVFKLIPSIESQPALVAELVSREFTSYKIMLYVANKYQHSELVSQYKQAIEQTDGSGKRKVTVVDYASDSIQGFRSNASLFQPNLVIIFAENEVLPAALLSKLAAAKDDYQVSVIGLPEWEKFSNIESNYLISLNAHVFMSTYTDYHSESMKGFILAYRAKYLDEPLHYAFTGFDAGYFFLGALLNYGKDFEGCINELRTPLIQNQFHFESNDGNGYDNVNWNVLQYLGYSLLKKSL